jgi:hypothetical protein
MKRKTKRGGSCSVFGTKKKRTDPNKLKQLFNELPPQISKQIEVLLKKDPTTINQKLKELKLEEVEEQHKKEEEELTSEMSKEVIPQRKMKKYIEVRQKQLSENTNNLVYSEQEKNILLEELEKLKNIFNSTTSVNVSTKSENAKPANATLTSANQTNEKLTSANLNAKPEKRNNSKVASLIDQPLVEVLSNVKSPL